MSETNPERRRTGLARTGDVMDFHAHRRGEVRLAAGFTIVGQREDDGGFVVGPADEKAPIAGEHQMRQALDVAHGQALRPRRRRQLATLADALRRGDAEGARLTRALLTFTERDVRRADEHLLRRRTERPPTTPVPPGARSRAPRARGRRERRSTTRATRAGPSADDGGEPPGLAAGELDRVRQEAGLRRRYPALRGLLAALTDFWGAGDAVRTAPGGSIHRACCPACRSKSRRAIAGWDRWPLCLADTDAGWALVAFCGCSPAAILRSLVAAQRATLDAELAELGSAAR